MRKLTYLIIAILCQVLAGCSHAQWATVETKTQLASWVNPVGFAVHMVAAAGAFATKPSASSGHTEDKPTKQ